jgi:hypothetical protein
MKTGKVILGCIFLKCNRYFVRIKEETRKLCSNTKQKPFMSLDLNLSKIRANGAMTAVAMAWR